MIMPAKEEKEAGTKFGLNCVYLYFSQYCNLKCRHCWINPKFSTDKIPKSDEIDIKSIISALGECIELGMTSVKVTGGEPFLREDIFELLAYIKSKNLGSTVETNATLIQEKEAQALKEANVSQVAVSLDGPDAFMHQSLRGIPGAFEEAVEGIKFLKAQDLNIQVIISLWRKTTLVHLIVKLYNISQGQILIDGQDIRLIKNKSLHEQIGVVLQKPILWNDNIRNNIIYAHPKASIEEVLYAAEIACADDFIKDLPQGFDTVVGENAIKLSEGQKQRVALARAIIKRPKILIIDEGMSSLDSQTEDKIIDNLKRELKNTTIIVVSHRLSTIKKMDWIYFLEAPDKITAGSYEQLAQDSLAYRELFASQLLEEEKINLGL